MTNKTKNLMMSKNTKLEQNIVDASYKSESTELHGPAQPISLLNPLS
jgi:hypothetical protein